MLKLTPLTVVAALALAAIGSATTLRPIADAELVRASQLIAVGSVGRIEALQRRDGRIVTETTLVLERIVKGRPRVRSIVVTQPGGRVDAVAQWVYGVAEFSVGERALVFLRAGRDRRLHPVGMALGKYAVEAGPASMARRRIPSEDVRGLDGFLDRLSALAATGPDRDRSVPSGRQRALAGEVTARSVVERFTLLDATPYRWFEPAVSFRVAGGDTRLGSSASRAALDQAMAAWTNVATSDLVLLDGGNTSAASQSACDGGNTIQFNDPFGEVDDLVGCSGVLAIGGFCETSGTMAVNGLVFHRIAEGDITVNNAFGACFNATDLAEVLTHELGHTIGLGHSSENGNEPDRVLSDATMYAYAHFDGRGAALRSDDEAGVAYIYPAASGGGGTGGQPDGDGDGVPDSGDGCPDTPNGTGVDSTGCPCSDPRHPGCDDRNACTDDTCNGASGHCDHATRVCDDANPCSLDHCDPTTGCENLRTGDRDADGICDAQDICPDRPGDPGSDIDQDGIGDACECTATPPGVCLPGAGAPQTRCFIEWRADAPAVIKRGVPLARLRCRDGDPTCDRDAVPGQCSIDVMVCVNNDDPRLPDCVPWETTAVALRSPLATRAHDPSDVANAAALTTATTTLVTAAPNTCSAPVRLQVPLQGGRAGRRLFKLRTQTLTGPGQAKLVVRCDP